MPRNKYPQETEKLILDVAMKLFIEKGYDNTSIQDIINKLGGLSKGAIYHHFHSKEDILIRIMDRMDEDIRRPLDEVCENEELSGYEKLKELFRQSLAQNDKGEAFRASPSLLQNPHMLVMHIESIFHDIVPNYVQPVIEQGVEDGSIQTEYPKELAEVLMLLSNIWLNPLMFDKSESTQSMMRRVEFYSNLLKRLGLDLLDDTILGQLTHMNDTYYKKGEKGQ